MNTIAALFSTYDSERSVEIERLRVCAGLTKPWILPPLDQRGDTRLPENYQSLGSRGVTNLDGRILMGVFPPEIPWLRQQAAAEIRNDPTVAPEDIQQLEAALLFHDLIIQASLETSSRDPSDPAGFRTSMRQGISHTIVTGETLMRLSDDFKVTVYRRDHYVNQRDPAGKITCHITREEVDLLTLTDAQIEMAGFSAADVAKMTRTERTKPLFTQIEWVHREKHWHITQEVNGKEINESIETVSPYINPTYELVAGEHYARGFIEGNFGDLRSLNTLSERILDFAAMASKLLGFLDGGSELKPEDFTKPSGSVIEGGRVVNGVLQDFAFLKVDKLSDFQVVFQTRESLRADLSAAMLIPSGAVRDSERTTAYEVAAITIKELEGALGGFYAPLADRLQVPIAHRVRHVLQKSGKLPKIDVRAVELHTLTGIAALASMQKATTLVGIAELVRGLGPEVAARLDSGVLLDAYMRYRGIYEPGLIKTKEQMEKELQQAMAAQAQAQAAEKTIDVAGNVAESAMTQPQGPQ